MDAADLLELPSVRFVEPQYADLPDPAMNDLLLHHVSDNAKILIDNEDNLLAVAFETNDGWVAGSFHLRPPSVEIIEELENSQAEMYEEVRTVWEAAVRSYYAQQIMDTVSPGMEEMNPDRIPLVRDLIVTHLGDISGSEVLDCCCGSGIGSLVLRELGAIPLAYDNDSELLSRGLCTGRLLPSRVLWIDGTQISRYVSHYPAAIGLMLGELNTLNEQIWQAIVAGILQHADRSLLTVGLEKETAFIIDAARAAGKHCRVLENTRDPIYDRWICIITGS